MTDPFGNIPAYGTGVSQRVAGGMISAREAKFKRDYDYAIKAHEHLWSAIAQFGISKRQLEQHGTDDIPMDAENLYSVMLGCYICEQIYDKQLLHRRCPGEPKDAKV